MFGGGIPKNVSRDRRMAYNPSMATVLPGRMQAAVLGGVGRVRLVSLPIPRPGRGEVLVRVRAVGVCRSDVHYYRTGRIGNQVIRRWPQTLGHEAAGEVAFAGPGVRGFKPGDRVAIEPATPCGKCVHCRAGRGNICPRVGFLGMPGHPGALAEYLVMPAGNLERLPEGISFEEGVALEPMAIGLHAVRLAGRLPREAAVVGVGPVRLAVLAALRCRGVRATVFDYLPARLGVARRMKASRTVRVGRRGSARGLAGKFALVFEAGGTPEAVSLALELAAPGGTVLLIGIQEGNRTVLDLHVARRKELAILNVRRSNGETREAIRLLSAGKLDLKPMVTHRTPLADAAKVFRMVDGYRDGVVKAVILP